MHVFLFFVFVIVALSFFRHVAFSYVHFNLVVAVHVNILLLLLRPPQNCGILAVSMVTHNTLQGHYRQVLKWSSISHPGRDCEGEKGKRERINTSDST